MGRTDRKEKFCRHIKRIAVTKDGVRDRNKVEE